MITIVDYGAGNLRSVQNTLDEIGASYQVTNKAVDIDAAEKIILPGVGHFGQMMQALTRLQIRQALIRRIQDGIPFLGICLGLQALFQSSEESADQTGLAIFEGQVKRFSGQGRIPHMGWNSLQATKATGLLANLPAEPYVYFAHSYYVPVTDVTSATCEYMQPYTAIVEHENVYGVQFHPEKSGPIGLQIVRNFVEL